MTRLRMAVLTSLLMCSLPRPQLFAQAARPPATPGALLIVSEPTGADVYVDGQRVGTSPVSLPAGVAGDHRVRVVKDGYLEHSRVVKTSARKPTTLQVRLTARPAASAAVQTAGLKILVVEGEDAVNIIQQKSAVAPVVEVRDKNNQPVGGVLVRFAIRGGRASFNGARTLSVTTNAAGRAAVSGLTPTTSGALQISASAAFQGQTAAITIAQTNVLTAAEAATAASAGGAGGAGGGATAGAGGTSGSAGSSAGASAGGAAGGGTGGGLSATTLGIVGGAAAGGTLVAVKAVGEELGAASGAYAGTLTLNAVQTASGGAANGCTWTLVITVTLFLDFDEDTHGTITKGHFDTSWTEREVSRSCSNTTAAGGTWGPQTTDIDGQPTTNIRFNAVDSGALPGGGTQAIATAFSGALAGDAVVGTFTISRNQVIQPGVSNGYPQTSGPVTLQRRTP